MSFCKINFFILFWTENGNKQLLFPSNYQFCEYFRSYFHDIADIMKSLRQKLNKAEPFVGEFFLYLNIKNNKTASRRNNSLFGSENC